MSTPDIRYEWTAPDLAQMLALYDQLGWQKALGLDADMLAQAMQSSLFVCCAYDGGQLVGTGRVVSDGALCAYICGLGVLPAFRGRGIGASIIQALTQRCAARGLRPQLLCAQPLVPYYEKLGYEVFGAGMRPAL